MPNLTSQYLIQLKCIIGLTYGASFFEFEPETFLVNLHDFYESIPNFHEA